MVFSIFYLNRWSNIRNIKIKKENDNSVLKKSHLEVGARAD